VVHAASLYPFQREALFPELFLPEFRSLCVEPDEVEYQVLRERRRRKRERGEGGEGRKLISVGRNRRRERESGEGRREQGEGGE
jgi:hypothetical protein